MGFGGGQVDITNGKFVFSCTEAYRVKDGKVGAPVKGATLIGDGATALQQIRALGNDMALDPGMGNCGKAGPMGAGRRGPAHGDDRRFDRGRLCRLSPLRCALARTAPTVFFQRKRSEIFQRFRIRRSYPLTHRTPCLFGP